MDTNTYVRKPFVVEAVEITDQNIHEVAKYIGDIKEKDDGTPYILVDRRLVPNVFKGLHRVLDDEDGRQRSLLFPQDLPRNSSFRVMSRSWHGLISLKW